MMNADIIVAGIGAFGTIISAGIAGLVLIQVNTVHRVVNTNHQVALARIASLEALLASSRQAEIDGLKDALVKAESQDAITPREG